jgi:ribosomal protein S18 acetylase RimI-like enzyme
VWVKNKEAIRFYENFGFEKGETIENYYKGIEEPHGVILRKKIYQGLD